jgi:hypothetical protein
VDVIIQVETAGPGGMDGLGWWGGGGVRFFREIFSLSIYNKRSFEQTSGRMGKQVVILLELLL